MNTCGYQKQVDSYLDGELSGEKLRAFEAHLQTCPRCVEIVEQTRGLLQELRAEREIDVPPGLQERLHAALLKETEKGDARVKRKVNPWALTAVAAALVVCLATGLALGGGGFLMNRAAGDEGRSGNMDTADYSGEQKNLAGEREEAVPQEEMPAPAATMAPEMKSAMDNGVEKGEEGALRATVGGKEHTYAMEQPQGEDQAQPGDGRKLIYTAGLVVESREYDACMAGVEGIIARYGGYVESSQSYGVPETNAYAAGRTAVITMRMPIGQYGAALAELEGLGNVLSKNEFTEDVSRQYVDTDARNKTLMLQREKLYELLEKADTMENIIALQNAITDLTTQIEQMTAQLRFWDDKVAYSSITVEVREIVTPKSVEPADPDLGTRANGALYKTLNAMREGAEDFAVGFVGFLPWLALLLAAAGICCAIVIPVVLRARRNRTGKENSREEGR